MQNTGSFNHEQRFAILDRLTILNEYRLDDAALVRLDLIEQFHCLDDAERVAFLDCLTYLYKDVAARRGTAVERAHHG